MEIPRNHLIVVNTHTTVYILWKIKVLRFFMDIIVFVIVLSRFGNKKLLLIGSFCHKVLSQKQKNNSEHTDYPWNPTSVHRELLQKLPMLPKGGLWRSLT